MILTNKVNIRINNINIKHYKNHFDNISLNNIINVPVCLLTKGSHAIIKIKCDKCGIERNIQYNQYYRFSKGLNKYFCKKCVKEITKKTMLDKYGCEYPLQNKKIKDKFIETNKLKYGHEYPMQNKNIQEKQQKTNKKRYGFEYVSLNNNIRNKQSYTRIKNFLKEYNNINFLSYDIEKKLIKLKCDKGHIFYITRYNLYNRKRYGNTLCAKCNPINKERGISDLENQLYNYIGNINQPKKNIKINNKELDIYIPELKLAFEFNGVYWHNELYKDKNYHLEKTELCEEKGISLIHIYEDDWMYKSDIVKSMILNKLGKTPNKIFARKCEIKEVNDNKLVREFLEHNHIQGFIGSKIKIGLFHENELVSLMTFGKRRISMGKKSSQEDEYELLRFCSKLNTNVVGGANKLFKYFVKEYKPRSITTYADRSWSTGGLYYKLGFSFKGKTQPNYYYVINGIRHHRFGFRKDVLVKEGYDASKTEHEIMLDKGIYRIFDSGNLKFEYIN
jgi:hypothetical protein